MIFLLIQELSRKLFHISSQKIVCSLISFKLEKSKNSTARISMWRQLNIRHIYTVETSIFGFDSKFIEKSVEFTIKELELIGSKLCEAIILIFDNNQNFENEISVINRPIQISN